MSTDGSYNMQGNVQMDPKRRRRLSYLFRSINWAPESTLRKIECIIAEDMVRDEQEGSPWVFTPVPSWQELFGSESDSIPLSGDWPRDMPHFASSGRQDESRIIVHKGKKYFCNRICARCLSLPCKVPFRHQHSECKCATCSWLDWFPSMLEVTMTVLASDVGVNHCSYPCTICGVSVCRRIDKHAFTVCICVKCLHMVNLGRRRCAYIWHTSPIIAGPPCSSLRGMHSCRGICTLCNIYECSIYTPHETLVCRCLKCRRLVAKPSCPRCILDEID